MRYRFDPPIRAQVAVGAASREYMQPGTTVHIIAEDRYGFYLLAEDNEPNAALGYWAKSRFVALK